MGETLLMRLIEGICKEYNVKVEIIPCPCPRMLGYLANITVDYDQAFNAWGMTRESALDELEELLVDIMEMVN